MDYLIPTALEVPDWETGFTVTPSPHHPIGAKGIGESATVGSPPTIVNAVCDALKPYGVRHMDMPCTPVAGVGRDAGEGGAAAMIAGTLARTAERLREDGAPYVHATVVRAQHPTSVHAGRRGARAPGRHDRGVRRRALRAGVGAACTPRRSWRRASRCCCGSCPGPRRRSRRRASSSRTTRACRGGAFEVFLEPWLPAPRLVRGRRGADGSGARRARRAPRASRSTPAASRTRATRRSSSPRTARARSTRSTAALRAGVPYVGLVASRTRGEAVRASLDVPDELRARVHVPAGLDIGARTPAEVARLDPRPDHRRARAAGRGRGRARTRTAVMSTEAVGRARARRGRLDAGSAGRSSCCPTATRRCSTTCSARRAPARSTSCSCALGGAADDVRATVDLRGADVVVNASSAAAARRRSRRRSGAVDPRIDVLVLLLGDQPGVRPETVRALLAGRGGAPLAACRYDDGRGHPLAFARSTFGDLAALHGDKGVWRLMDRADVVGGRRSRARSRATSTPGRTTKLALLAAARRCRGAVRDAVPDVETLWPASPASTTSPTRASPPRCSSRCASRSRCCSRARPGVGKTEAAKSLAAVLGTPLIRLQCYEGIDAAEALYEWNYPRQLLRIRHRRGRGRRDRRGATLFGPEYLIAPAAAAGDPAPRPAARGAARRRARPRRRRLRGLPPRAARRGERSRSPSSGRCARRTRRSSSSPPTARATCTTRSSAAACTTGSTTRTPSARSRSCAAACRARALTLAVDVAAAVRRLRGDDLQKPPGIAEAIDWVAALELLGVDRLDAAAADRTLGAVLKYREDQELDARARPRAAGGHARWLSSASTCPPWRARSGARCTTRACPSTPERAARFARAARARAAVRIAPLLDGAGRVRLPPRPARRLRRGLRRSLRRHRRSRRRRAATRTRPPIAAGAEAGERPGDAGRRAARRPSRAGAAPQAGLREGASATMPERDAPIAAASAEERLRDRDFAELDAEELLALRRLMRELALAPPPRRTRRARRDRRGDRLDVRATLRASHRTGGDPARRIMPPAHARAAPARRAVRRLGVDGALRAGVPAVPARAVGGADAEAFVFATRLTRLTRALRARQPDLRHRARRRAAPRLVGRHADRRGAARSTTDYGRRGMARGAVVVIVSDGWERGDPELVAERDGAAAPPRAPRSSG